jgi:hypothetical protein
MMRGHFPPRIRFPRAGLPRPARALLLALAALGLAAGPALADPAPSLADPAPPLADPAPPRPRIIVLSDIGNEPDDSESLVRLLLYANEFDIEGLIATTSTWQRDRVRPDLMLERIDAYGQVYSNLTHQAPGYLRPEALRARVIAGTPLYGMAGVGRGHESAAARAIIAAVDRPDPRPVWVLCWGGTVDLAQALWQVRATRSPAQVKRFLSHLRVYSISDQDDAGPWARHEFPGLFWIASIHGWGQYNMAAWSGISGDRRTAERWPDRDMILDPWLSANIRRGPLGALYPLPAFIMEGDTPAFLSLIPNGLSDPEHPEWGGWGGRYVQQAPGMGLYADAKDLFERDGTLYSGNQATVYRWRARFQNDFAARIGWTLSPDRARANHAPVAVAQGQAGRGVVRLAARSGQTITLDAAGSGDPDGDAITAHWWQYREVGGLPPQPPVAIATPDAMATQVTLPSVTAPATLHIILEVTDHGTPALTSYRRIILDVRP